MNHPTKAATSGMTQKVFQSARNVEMPCCKTFDRADHADWGTLPSENGRAWRERSFFRLGGGELSLDVVLSRYRILLEKSGLITSTFLGIEIPTDIGVVDWKAAVVEINGMEERIISLTADVVLMDFWRVVVDILVLGCERKRRSDRLRLVSSNAISLL